jgi:cyclophilin family peptidyl-prolyl cis-trans isomerase
MMMFKTLKRILTIAVASSLMLMLAACGEQGDTGSGNTATTPDNSGNNAPEPITELETPSITEEDMIHNTSFSDGNIEEVTLEAGDTYAVISIKEFGDITVKLFPDNAPVAVQNFIDLANDGYYTDKIFHRIIPNFMAQGGSPFGDGSGVPGGETFDVERSYNMRHFYGAFCMANAGGQNSQQFYIVNEKNSQNPLSDNITMQINQQMEQANAWRAEIEEFLADPDNSLSELRNFTAAEFANIIATYQNMVRTYGGMDLFKNSVNDDIIAKYEKGGVPFLDGGYTVFGHMTDGFDVLDAVSSIPTDANDRPNQEVVIESVTIHVFEG